MITTQVLNISSTQPDPRIIYQAAEMLRRGGLVAFPTETVYGLGGDAFSEKAITKVFEAKGRPTDNPLIVHISDVAQLDQIVAAVPSKARLLIENFWPGPLTIVLRRSSRVPDLVTAGLDTVAVRMPKNRVALELIRAFGGGVVGPSANTSGKPSPTKADHVLADLRGKVDIILDAGQAEIGLESTIVDVTTEPPLILRQGGLPQGEVERIIGHAETTEDIEHLKRSPGTRHRHYAPAARVIIVEEDDGKQFAKLVQRFRQTRMRIGCIIHSDGLRVALKKDDYMLAVGSTEELSRNLYDALRYLDSLNVDVILVESVSEEGLGIAVMDRVRRAASVPMHASAKT